MDLLNIGTVDQFAAVRAAFRKATFTESSLCERLQLPRLDDFEDNPDNEQNVPFDSDALGILLRLFIEGRYAPVAAAERHLGTEALQAMADLGLIQRDVDQTDLLFGKVGMVPTRGMWLATDRWNTPDRSSYFPGVDIVYNPIGSNTQRFLRFMPELPCRTFLDLCSGTGVAGLHAARSFAQAAWAADIAERSTNFAEFNRRLNVVQNLTPVTGDLYEPVAGTRFDYIVAHPPYVPVLRPKYIFYDGGDDGEQILRRVITEAPKNLAPGGWLYVLAMASDRDRLYEMRMRDWLGDAQAEFDIGLFPVRFIEPKSWAAQAVTSSPTPAEDRKSFLRLFEERNVKTLVYAAALLHRHEQPRQPITLRRSLGATSSPQAMLDAMRIESVRLQPGANDQILNAKYRVNNGVELNVPHKLGESGWQPEVYRLQVAEPFGMEARVEPWSVHALMYCDGQHTVEQVFEILIAEQVFQQGSDPREFARGIGVLVSAGFLVPA